LTLWCRYSTTFLASKFIRGRPHSFDKTQVHRIGSSCCLVQVSRLAGSAFLQRHKHSHALDKRTSKIMTSARLPKLKRAHSFVIVATLGFLLQTCSVAPRKFRDCLICNSATCAAGHYTTAARAGSGVIATQRASSHN
jgi:hypothetical protein